MFPRFQLLSHYLHLLLFLLSLIICLYLLIINLYLFVVESLTSVYFTGTFAVDAGSAGISPLRSSLFGARSCNQANCQTTLLLCSAFHRIKSRRFFYSGHYKHEPHTPIKFVTLLNRVSKHFFSWLFSVSSSHTHSQFFLRIRGSSLCELLFQKRILHCGHQPLGRRPLPDTRSESHFFLSEGGEDG